MLQAMFVTKIKIVSTITLMSLPCSGVCLTGYSSTQGGHSAPIQAQPARDYGAKLLAMYAGNEDPKKLAENAGTKHKHVFRVVNTSKAPLRIISLRKG
jgi:hypothetical protein